MISYCSFFINKTNFAKEIFMPQENGNVVDCLGKLIHHVSPTKVRLMIAAGCDITDFEHRFTIIRQEAELSLAQIKKIKELAERNDYEDVLNIINEQLTYGHNL